MKRQITLLMMALVAIATYAQKDVTTFLGIPVDGFKPAMEKKLIAKGFVPQKTENDVYFEGEFNGSKVNVFIVTNNNKVWRIMLVDVINRSEADIKTRFNTLVNQFKNNKRYLDLDETNTLPDSEDISYEMAVNNKIYEATFYQDLDFEKLDTLAMNEQVRKKLLEKYTPEQLQEPTDEILEKEAMIKALLLLDCFYKKSVWFRIRETYGKYYITMYYDNEYNHANGEDL